MTETRQTAFFTLSLLTLITALGTLAVGFKTLDQYRTDNQTIATLRAEVTQLKADLHDTEVALDTVGLESVRLQNDNEVLRARVEIAERKKRL